jgi:hypothetical protein
MATYGKAVYVTDTRGNSYVNLPWLSGAAEPGSYLSDTAGLDSQAFWCSGSTGSLAGGNITVTWNNPVRNKMIAVWCYENTGATIGQPVGAPKQFYGDNSYTTFNDYQVGPGVGTNISASGGGAFNRVYAACFYHKDPAFPHPNWTNFLQSPGYGLFVDTLGGLPWPGFAFSNFSPSMGFGEVDSPNNPAGRQPQFYHFCKTVQADYPYITHGDTSVFQVPHVWKCEFHWDIHASSAIDTRTYGFNYEFKDVGQNLSDTGIFSASTVLGRISVNDCVLVVAVANPWHSGKRRPQIYRRPWVT